MRIGWALSLENSDTLMSRQGEPGLFRQSAVPCSQRAESFCSVQAGENMEAPHTLLSKGETQKAASVPDGVARQLSPDTYCNSDVFPDCSRCVQEAQSSPGWTAQTFLKGCQGQGWHVGDTDAVWC